jgi:hypothetical protein
LVSTGLMSSVLKTHVNHSPPSWAFIDIALPHGVYSVAEWSSGQTTSMYWPFARGACEVMCSKARVNSSIKKCAAKAWT